MAEGFLIGSGQWVAGAPAETSYQGADRFIIRSTDEDLAETVVRRRAAVTTDALSTAPLLTEHIPSGQDVIWYG